MATYSREATHVMRRRVVQYLVDMMLYMMASSMLSVGTGLLAILIGVRGKPILHAAVGAYIGGLIVTAVLNEVLLPVRNRGATIGMEVTGLRITTLDAQVPTWRQCLVRHLLWVVDGLLWGVVALVMMWRTPYRQRVGDLVARTVVIRSDPAGAPTTGTGEVNTSPAPAARGSADQPVLPGPDGELGAVAEPQLALRTRQMGLDGGQ